MIKVKAVFLTGMLFFIMNKENTYAQEIRVSDKVPNVYLPAILNHRKSSGYLLTEFGEKPLIIDFWFTRCGTCIAEMPHNDSLRRKYGADINFLYVTYEPMEKVKDFFSKKEKLKNLNIVTVTSDTIIKKLFPNIMNPHVVWIDKTGVVQAITGGEYITDKNIDEFSKGVALKLPIKVDNRDRVVAFGSIPLFTIDERYNANRTTKVYSFLGGYNSQFNGFIFRFEMVDHGNFKGFLRSRIGNVNLLSMFNEAYRNRFKRNQVVAPDDLMQQLQSADFKKEYAYCYDLITADTSKERAYKKFRHDLDDYFSVKTRVINSPVDCYILKKINNVSINSKSETRDRGNDNGIYVFKKTDWNVILNVFVNGDFNLPYEVIDETGIDPSLSVDVAFPLNWSNVEQCNVELKKYGLSIGIEKRDRKTLVLERDIR